jgi:hypothetical protein
VTSDPIPKPIPSTSPGITQVSIRGMASSQSAEGRMPSPPNVRAIPPATAVSPRNTNMTISAVTGRGRLVVTARVVTAGVAA